MDRFSPAAIGLWIACCAAANLAHGKPLTGEDVVDLRYVREVAVSPDGRAVAYVLEVPRGEEDPPGRSFGELWVVGPDLPARRFVGGKRVVAGPEWSPSGDALRYRRIHQPEADDEEGTAELFEIPLHGGESRRLLDTPGSVQLQRASPTGERMALVIRDAETEQQVRDKQAGRDWKVFDENPRYRRLWIWEAASGSLRRWVDEDLDVSDLVWAADGGAVIVRAASTPRVDDEYMNSQLYRVPLVGPPRRLTTTPGKLGPMAVSPDGKRLAFLAARSRNDPLAQSLFLVDTEGGASRNLTESYEGSIADLLWSAEHGLLVVAVEGAGQALYRVDPASGRRTRIDWPRLVIRDADARAGTLAVVAESPDHPDELFTLEAPGAVPLRRSKHNPSLEERSLARQEAIEWRGADGLRITGVLTYPLDYRRTRRYPLVLQVHGGPEGVSLDGWTTSALTPVQLLAARGFAVLQPNYRGSQGRGVPFSQADHDDLGGKEFDDVLAGIAHLADLGLVDPGRVGIGGWSYGGYFAAWAATRHSERFRAAVVAAGLTNWIAFAGTTDIPHEMSLVHWNSWWFDEPELHWSRSPLAHLQRATTPTLIVHGARDARVHPEQGLELYTALRIKAVPTQLVVYPREPHGLRERAHRLDFIERSTGWFERHLAEESAIREEPGPTRRRERE